MDICLCVYVCEHLSVCVCVCVCLCICVCVDICLCMHVCGHLSVCVFVDTCLCVRASVCVYVRVDMYHFHSYHYCSIWHGYTVHNDVESMVLFLKFHAGL